MLEKEVNNMDENKNKPPCKHLKCQFYDKEKETCTIKNVQEFSKKDCNSCTDFIVHEKLIMF